MSRTRGNQLSINNLNDLEELNDHVAEFHTGGAARFVGIDNDSGERSPEIEISRRGASFNLARISRRIGTDIDNILDRFVVRGTERGERYQVLLFDNAQSTGNPERYEFTGTGGTVRFSARSLRNRVSSVRLRQIS